MAARSVPGCHHADVVQTAVELRDLTTLAEFETAGELVRRVWGTAPERSPLNVQQLPAMVHAGCQVSGAFEGDRMVGATMAFVGLEDGQPILHSHVTGVDPDRQGRGLGVALKRYQRRWCLERGIGVVTWTFDPVVVANGRFNLNRLGARGVGYLRDFYGRMGDELNRDDPTDRLLTRWSLESPGVLGALATDSSATDSSSSLIADGAEHAVADEGGEPAAHDTVADVRLIAVPGDVVALRRDEPDRSTNWRTAVRAALEAALDDGHEVTAVTTDGCLVTEVAGATVANRGAEQP